MFIQSRYSIMLLNKFNKKFIKEVLMAIVGIATICILCYQQLFIKKLKTSIINSQQDQEILIERFNNKLEKLTKQLRITTEENNNIKYYNQKLEQEIAEFQNIKNDMDSKLYQATKKKSQIEQTHLAENNMLQNKIKNLLKENSDLHNLIKELQTQIKNHKVNSYGLFQAGKLEIELSNLDQQLSEQYENINQKKIHIITLKDKCGTLRTNSKFCKEYDTTLNNITLLEKQLEDLQSKREDLKQRIHVYLSSSIQTNPH